jgi:hypothetical protein
MVISTFYAMTITRTFARYLERERARGSMREFKNGAAGQE